MFNIGFDELILFGIVLFILFPDSLPTIFAKLGQLLGKLRNFRNEVYESFDIDNIKKEFDPLKKEFNPSSKGSVPQEKKIKIAENEEKKQAANKKNADKINALNLLWENFDFKYTDQALKYLFDEEREVKEYALRIVTMDPLFAFEKRTHLFQKPGDIVLTNEPLFLTHLFSTERKQQYAELINKMPDKAFGPTLEYLVKLPGIDNLPMDTLFKGTKANSLTMFRALQKKERILMYPYQLTISPSYDCNLQCRYCFSRDLKNKFPIKMKLDQFKALIDKVNKQKKIYRVSILGGEPTIFPELEAFITEIEQRNLRFYFSTNGLSDPVRFQHIIQSKHLDSITFHIEKDRFYSKSQIETLMTNLKSADNQKIRVFIRYNLEIPDFDKWDFLLKYVSLLSRFDFSFAVIFPSKAGKNTFVRLNELEKFRHKILSLIFYIINNVKGKKVNIVMAKPYPLCLFSEHELKLLLRYVKLKNICEIDKNNGTNNICINPDESYFPCMALNSDEYLSKNIDTLDNLPDKYHSMIEKLITIPLLEKCKTCQLHYLGVCQAACYSYI